MATTTADLLTIKLMLNSIISTPNTRWMMVEINILYLHTELKQCEYLKLWLCDLPEDVTEHYELTSKATPEEFVYVEVHKGMYGLP